MATGLDTIPSLRIDGRDRYVDFLRAFGLVALVVWHWAFTILQWNPRTGPTAISPVGFTPGLWLITWIFQATPLMFFVGGYAHMRSWQRAQQDGSGLAAFVARRLRQLALPGGGVLLGWVVIGGLAGWYFDLYWMARFVRIVVSPLWFLAVYLVLIALLPVAFWLHNRFGALTLIWLAGIALCVDVVRFQFHLGSFAWVNVLVVWALAHQAGLSYQSLVDAPRRLVWALLWGGLLALAGMIGSAGYPGSMIGVYGERFSNMAPPTFVIVALLACQLGGVALLRPAVERLLSRPYCQRLNTAINRVALPLFLLHSTGMAIAVFGYARLLHDGIADRTPPDLFWWLSRPLALLTALACTAPLIWLYTGGPARLFHVRLAIPNRTARDEHNRGNEGSSGTKAPRAMQERNGSRTN